MVFTTCVGRFIVNFTIYSSKPIQDWRPFLPQLSSFRTPAEARHGQLQEADYSIYKNKLSQRSPSFLACRYGLGPYFRASVESRAILKRIQIVTRAQTKTITRLSPHSSGRTIKSFQIGSRDGRISKFDQLSMNPEIRGPRGIQW